MLSDLRQSGQIEEAADMALLLYRPSYYDPEDEGYDEVDVAKYRGGSTEVLVAKMDVLHNCWRNADRTEYPQPQQRIAASQEDLPF
jgi:replicative DNA helicase